MRVTKFVHSCLLLESPEGNVLIDPGDFSWSSGLVDINKFPKLSCVVVTHEHQDHFSMDFARALQEKMPNLIWIAPPAVMQQLAKLDIEAITANPSSIEVYALKHERVPWKGANIDNWGVNVLGQLTHPGDSFALKATKPVLALPVTAPWGSMTEAVELALKLKPKTILPIHDWHWNEHARNWSYSVMEEIFAEHDIKFISLKDGEPVQL